MNPKCPVCGLPHGRGADHTKCSRLIQKDPTKYGLVRKRSRRSKITKSSLSYFASL